MNFRFRNSSDDSWQATEEHQGEVHEVVAAVESQPTDGHVFLFDGFTVTPADTPENQEVFPQNPSQKEGLGFPILRCVSLISMVTGLLFDLAIGPYSGKQSGETALLWKMLVQLGLETSSSQTVGNRPDRVEPRANKRRPKLLALLTKPRHVAKLELGSAA